MSNVIKNVFFKNYIVLFMHKTLQNRLLVPLLLSSLFTLQYCPIGYAMQQVDESFDQHYSKKSSTQNRVKEMNNISELDSISDEEKLPFPPVTEETNQSWKQNWFVKNVIVEFPIVGDFFRDNLSALGLIREAGKSTSMLVGGTFGMMMHFIPMSEKDDMAAKMSKDTFNMAVGMWVGVVGYNIVLGLGEAGYNCCKKMGYIEI